MHKLTQLSSKFILLAAVLLSPAALHAENQISLYFPAAALNESAIKEGMEKYPGGSADYNPNPYYGYGFRYTYWSEGNLGFALDFDSYGYSGLPDDKDTLEVHTTSLLGFYRFGSANDQIEPYIGAGVGNRLIEQYSTYQGQSDDSLYENVPNFSGIIGANCHLNQYFSLFGEVRVDYSLEASAASYSSVKGEFPSLLTPALNMGVSFRF